MSTMKLEHTKSAKSPTRGCSVVQQVHMSLALEILPLLSRASAPQQPHPCGRSVSNTGSKSLSAQTAGGHSLENKIEGSSKVAIHPKKTYNSN